MVYRTMQGREIDIEKLMKQNETMPAIGNMQVNARGDELGPGGVIVRKREDIVAEYYDQNPNNNIKQTKAVAPKNDPITPKSTPQATKSAPIAYPDETPKGE